MTNKRKIGWFADVGREDEPDEMTGMWQPCLALGTGHIPSLAVWHETKEACERYIKDELIPAGSQALDSLDYLDELADLADKLFRPDLDAGERASEFLASLPTGGDGGDPDEWYRDARRQAWEAQQAKWVGSWSCVIGLAQEMAQPEHKTAPRHNARVATECVCWKGEA